MLRGWGVKGARGEARPGRSCLKSHQRIEQREHVETGLCLGVATEQCHQLSARAGAAVAVGAAEGRLDHRLVGVDDRAGQYLEGLEKGWVRGGQRAWGKGECSEDLEGRGSMTTEQARISRVWRGERGRGGRGGRVRHGKEGGGCRRLG